jgi:integrase/recombinase XerD
MNIPLLLIFILVHHIRHRKRHPCSNYQSLKIRELGVHIMTDQQALVPVQAGNDDDKLILTWLATKASDNTRRAYTRIAQDFVAYVDKPLQTVTLADIQAFLATVEGKASSQALAVNAIKSLFTFGTELGYFPVNVARVVKAPKQRSELAQRILTPDQAKAMVNGETNKRNHAILRLLYSSGLRVSEIVALKWADIRRTDNGAVLDVFGKGEKQRYVLISKGMVDELEALDGRYLGSDRYVFQSRESKGGTVPMAERQVNRIVLAAAERAGIDANVSAHWLRHSNATHALKNGASLPVVQQSLGHSSLVTTSTADCGRVELEGILKKGV